MIDIYGYKQTLEESKPTDVILNSLNRLNIGKQTGALKDTEFAELLVHTGDLVANAIKIGKVSEEDVDSIESFVTQFNGENANNYFSYNHKALKEAVTTFIEGDTIALQAYEERKEISTHSKRFI